jgi:hypothetical protein
MKVRFHLFVVCGVACAVFTLAGCRRKPSPPPLQPDAPATVAETPTPTPVAPPPPSPAEEAPAAPVAGISEESPELAELNRGLELFMIRHNRFPRDLRELVVAEELHMPPLSAGAKLVIDQKAKKVRLVKP